MDKIDVLMRGFIMQEAVHMIYGRYRTQVSEKVSLLKPCPAEIKVAMVLTMKATRLCSATEAIARAGLEDEAYSYLRIPTENVVNLLFICHSGPEGGFGSSNELAKRYMEYGDVQHRKLMRKAPSKLKEMTANDRGMSEQDRIEHEAKIASSAEQFEAIYAQENPARWHSLSFEDMFLKVKENPPNFATEEPDSRGFTIWDYMHASVTSQNCGIHGNSFSDRSFWKAGEDDDTTYLLDERSVKSNWADVAAIQAYWAWCVMANFFGQTPSIQCLWRQEVQLAGERTLAEKH